MRYLTFALVAVLVSQAGLAGGSSQTKPDFSGSWRLDPARSDAAAQAETPGPVTIVIKQSAAELHITTTTTRGTTDMRYPFVAADAPLTTGPNARWQGDTLVTPRGQRRARPVRHRATVSTAQRGRQRDDRRVDRQRAARV